MIEADTEYEIEDVYELNNTLQINIRGQGQLVIDKDGHITFITQENVN